MGLTNEGVNELKEELAILRALHNRLGSEVISADKLGHDLQLLISGTQDEYVKFTGSVASERNRLDLYQEELSGLDKDRMDKLQLEQRIDREFQITATALLGMQDHVVGLNDELSKRREVLRAVEGEVLSARQALDCAISTLRIKRNQRDGLYNEAAELARRIKRADGELMEIGNLYQSSRDRDIVKRRVLSELQTHLDVLRNEHNTILRRLESTKAEVNGIRTSIRDSSEQLTQRTHERSAKERILAQALAESNHLSSIVESKRSQISKLEREIIELEMKRDRTREQMSLVNQGHSAMDKEISDAEKILAELETDVAEVINQIAVGKTSLLTDTTVIDSCRSQIAGLDIELKSMESLMGSLPSQLVELRDQSGSLDAHLVELDYQIEIETRKLECGGLRIVSESEKGNMLDRIKSLEDEIAAATTCRINIQSGLSKLRTEIRLSERGCEEVKQDVVTRKDEVYELEALVESLEREVESARKSLVDILVLRDKLIADLRDKKKELRGIISNLYATQTDLTELDKVVINRRKEESTRLEDLKLISKELHQERHDLRKRVWEVQHATALMKSKLESIKEREERTKIPEEDLGVFFDEIESVKSAIESARKDLSKIDMALEISKDTDRSREFDELSKERDQLRSSLYVRAEITDPVMRRALASSSYQEWTKYVSESHSGLFEELKKDLACTGIEFP